MIFAHSNSSLGEEVEVVFEGFEKASQRSSPNLGRGASDTKGTWGKEQKSSDQSGERERERETFVGIHNIARQERGILRSRLLYIYPPVFL